MTIDSAYIQFLNKVNRNADSNNITASKDRFVTLYNEEQIRRMEGVFQDKNSDFIREIQQFLVTKNNLLPTTLLDTKATVLLPTDYFQLSSAYIFAETKKCKQIRVSLFEIKDLDTEQVLSDKHNEPSLRYREAPFYIGSDAIQVFTKDFKVSNATVTYYRYPRKVDMQGIIKEDGTAGNNIDPEGDDAWVNRVISMCAESYFRNNGDTAQIQINKDRIVNNH